MKHASMWANLVDADNGINSNYGQYVFNTNVIKNSCDFLFLKIRERDRANNWERSDAGKCC